MTTSLIVGIDGSGSGARALEHAKTLSRRIDACRLVLVYVIEWSPFTFQTADENAERHRRREEEIGVAHARILDPALAMLKADAIVAEGLVRHGDAAEILDAVAVERDAAQIVIARSSDAGLIARMFGSVTVKLVTSARVPVTVVP